MYYTAQYSQYRNTSRKLHLGYNLDMWDDIEEMNNLKKKEKKE